MTDANGVVLDTSGISGGNSYHVIYLDGTLKPSASITETTVIDGFIITGGQADDEDNFEHSGGGLFCDGFGEGGECSPMVTNVVFSGNFAIDSGGAMKNKGLAVAAARHSLTLSSAATLQNLAELCTMTGDHPASAARHSSTSPSAVTLRPGAALFTTKQGIVAPVARRWSTSPSAAMWPN